MADYIRLCDLSLYRIQSWYTRGRVIRLDDCRAYDNTKGSGTVFTFAISDETLTMECVSFGERAKTLNTQLQLTKMYTFRSVRLMKKKGRFYNSDAPFQLVIHENSKVSETSTEETGLSEKSPEIEVNLLDFADLGTAIKTDCRIDLLGILKVRENAAAVTSRTTNESLNRSGILLENERSQQVAITLWNVQVANVEKLELNQPIIVTDVHGEVDDNEGLFNGDANADRNVAVIVLTGQNSTTFYDARAYDDGKALLEATAELDSQNSGSATSRTAELLTAPLQKDYGSNAPLKLVSAIPLAVFNRVETEYFRVIAIVTAAPPSPNFYLRCPLGRCGAKVQKLLLGHFECSKCNKRTNLPSVGLTLVVDVQDYSGTAMLTLFNDSAAVYLNQSLDSAKALYDRDRAAFNAHLYSRQFQHFEFRVSVSRDAQGVFSGRCWSLRSLSEKTHFQLLTRMKTDNDNCIVKSDESSLEK